MTTPTELLRGAGLRSTAPRRAVLSALIGAPHTTAAALADMINGHLDADTADRADVDAIPNAAMSPNVTVSPNAAVSPPATVSPTPSPLPPALSHQGLYNVLDDLTAAGLIRCIRPAGSAARYELRVGDNHHHLVCRSCGRVADVDCAVGEAPCLEPSSTPGFARVDEAEVVWWGTCDECASQLVDAKAPLASQASTMQ